MKQLTAQELTAAITDYVNTFGDKSKEFNEAMSREHRTLQQSFTRLCFQWIEYVASNKYQTDGRNADSKRVAELILSLMHDHYSKEFSGLTLERMIKPSNFLPTI